MAASYAELSAKALTPQQVKATVDLSAVVLSYGVELTSVAGGEKLTGCCPFHDDETPSFSVWLTETGEWACGCWACPFGPTDLFGFIMEWEQCTFGTALAKAINLDPDDLPEPPDINTEPVVRAVVSLESILSRGTEIAAVQDLLDARGIDVPVDWLETEFGVVADGETVLIPHWVGMELIGIKRRSEYMGWKSIAARGSVFSHLYGTFRYPGCGSEDTVILCEGESDTWTVSYLYRSAIVAVVGLPCGVNAAPRDGWLKFIGDRDVLLLFDADPPGRTGRDQWASVLPGCVWTVDLPDGADATSVGRDGLYAALASPRLLHE